MPSDIDLALIYGSARPGRICDVVADWTVGEIRRRGGFTVDVLDPASPDLAPAISGHETGRAELCRRLGRAEAFVIVTPEYNHSYPAPLKALIDVASKEWHAKPAAFVSYGGISGGLRAVEHLRLVLAELHAVGIRDGVSFASVWDRFGPDGALRDPAGAEAAAALMLGRLAWWARALSSARSEQEYTRVAA